MSTVATEKLYEVALRIKEMREIAGYTVDVTRTCYTPKELEMIKAALTK